MQGKLTSLSFVPTDRSAAKRHGLTCLALHFAAMLSHHMSHLASSPQELGKLCFESSLNVEDQNIDDHDEVK